MTTDSSSTQLPLVLKDAASIEDTIGITASEVDSLESERAKQIQSFRDEDIMVLRAKQLPQGYQFSKDVAPLLLPLDKMRIYPGLNPRLPSAEWEAHIESLKEGGFKPEVQHLPPIKVRRCHHLVRPRPINNFSLKIASPLPV